MSRKYGQRGYQEDDRERRPAARGPRPERDGPRGRGLGKPTATRFRCARCGADVRDLEVDFEATCGACGSALHSCVNCTFFDTGATFECRAPIEIRIPAKSKANECTHFVPKAAQEFASEAEGPAPTDGKAAFDDLFDF